MYQPNSACIVFCYWMLNLASQRLSSSQRLVVLSVYNAAVGNYPVSSQLWHNFNLFTAWRKPFYDVYAGFAAFTAPSLLTNVIHAYNFESNSNDLAGANNGADTAIIYGAAFGKITDGANFNGVNSGIALAPINSTLSFSFAFWFKPGASLAAYSNLFAAGVAGNGLYWQPSVQRLVWFTGAANLFGPVISTGAWHSVVINCTAGVLTAYLDNVPYAVGITLGAPLLFDAIGSYLTNNPFTGDIDILNMWSAPLSMAEADLFYNAGAGLQYPF